MHFMISGRDWRLPKYHPRNPDFEEEDDENEREGGDKVLGTLVLLS